ncbi:MAG TPA: hypothetical protein DDW65_21390 [Firmicutes bacterium]|jgi:signal transduction histidine kinase/ActR/RegA family two-component response regulator|nr:hypothetical protein [Bacillota bacterium]
MKLKIQTKISLGFFSVITAMALLIIGGQIYTNIITTQARTAANRYSDAVNLDAKLIVEIRSAETAVKDFWAEGDNLRLVAFRNSLQKSRRYLGQLKELLTKDTKAAAIINDSIEPYLDYLDSVVSKGKGNQQLTKNLRRRINSSIKAESLFFDQLGAMNSQTMNSYINLSRRIFKITFMLILAIALLSIIVGHLITKSTTASLRILTKGIRSASTGKYVLIEEIQTSDEVKDLVIAFNHLVTTVQTNETVLQHKNEELQAQDEELTAQNEEILAQQEELQQAIASLTKHEELLSGLYKFSQTLTQTIELDDLMEIAFNGILNEAEAQIGAFFLYNSESGMLEMKNRIGLLHPEKLSNISLNNSLTGRAGLQKKVLAVSFPEGQLRSIGLRGELAMASEIYLPLFHGELLGVIALGCTGKKEFSVEEQKRLSSLADQIAVALHNSLAHLEIRRSLERIQEVDQLKSELINTVSHELRTPLASIYGFAELLLQKHPGETKAQKYITTIYNESLRLSGLINNFLDLQRIENRHLEINTTLVDLCALVKSSVEIYQGQSSLHDFKINCEPDLPQINTDSDRVAQVLGNLLSNAIKYSPAGGLIEITVYRSSVKEVAVAVKDHGLGIPADAIPNIFHPFFRVDNSDRRQIGGTGLGLAICHKMIRVLGGDIGVRSEHGKGSVFTFLLPINNASAIRERTAGGEETTATSPGDKLIVVVEDDPAMAELMEESLNSAGYRTQFTDNGPEALALIERQSPEAIILDLILPGPYDGWEIMRRLKKDKSTADIPIIISSSLDQKRQGLELGAADYLVKPFSSNKLVESVNKVLTIASGVIGLPGQRRPDIEGPITDLLKAKGFVVKEIIKEPDLLVVVLDNSAVHIGSESNK